MQMDEYEDIVKQAWEAVELQKEYTELVVHQLWEVKFKYLYRENAIGVILSAPPWKNNKLPPLPLPSQMRKDVTPASTAPVVTMKNTSLQPARCKGKTKPGTRCKKKTKFSNGFCRQHGGVTRRQSDRQTP